MANVARNDAVKELLQNEDSGENSSNHCQIVYVLGNLTTRFVVLAWLLCASFNKRNNLCNVLSKHFLTGGPGSGKSTQCSKIATHLGFCHLSAGDLLQAEVDSGSDYGKMIQDSKKEGKLVPSEIIVKLLQKAMQGSQKKKFIIDGFPRNEENLAAAENALKIESDAVLFFDCSEEEMIRRLLNRNQGRVDDNIDTIKKRLKVYHDSTKPVINYYSSKGKIRKIDTVRPIEEVFDAVKGVFSELKAEPGKNKNN